MPNLEDEEFYLDEDEESEVECSDDGDTPTDPNVFRIRRSLDPFSATAMTAAELHNDIMHAYIDLSPSYQRDVVWSTQKQMAIIDSLFHNYFVPPVVFAVREDEEGYEMRVCVDGKQRLTSIYNFMAGEIAYKDPDTKKCWWYTVADTQKHHRAQLPKEGRELFAQKELTCVEYHNLSPVAEREVFRRVQLGMSLTPAEQMHAISSPWTTWISKLEYRYISRIGGLTDLIKFETVRGRNFFNIAAVVFCCQGLPYYRQTPASPNIARWLRGDDSPSEEFKKQIYETLDSLVVLATNPNLNRAFRGKDVAKKVAPVEFIFLGVLLFKMQMKEFDNDERADAAHYLRVQLRKQVKDVRLNERVCRVCWDTIDNALKRQSGSSSSVVAALNRTNGVPMRKKRQVRANDDDLEYRASSSSAHNPTPVKRSRRDIYRKG